MSGKKYGKGRQASSQASQRQSEKVVEGPPVELENQFVLRLPEEPASALREAIKSGASNLKERLFIQLEPDKGSNTQYLRKGHVQVSFLVGKIFILFHYFVFFSLIAGTALPVCWTCRPLLSLTKLSTTSSSTKLPTSASSSSARRARRSLTRRRWPAP